MEIIPGDANIKLVELCRRLDWKRRRGVVFVDPCGPETDWAMLRAIAATKALDMFWLFPLSAVYRNAPHDHGMLTPEKRAMVTRCLDCTEWEDNFYGASDAVVRDLFDNAPKVRHVDIENIETFVMQRLGASLRMSREPARTLGDE